MPNELKIVPGAERGPWLPGQIEAWAADQLEVAAAILGNPGGGLLFATQTIGQVKAALQERDERRYAAAVDELDVAERLAVRRDYEAALARLALVRRSLAH